MSSKKMLIDAAHPEEIRVVTMSGNRLEDFDAEVASRKQLKGNIYLAKVARVEASLQAAFVEYGGNRHGFLAFDEIHPDYYQIPIGDREALLAEEQKAVREDPEQTEGGEDGKAVETVGGDDAEEAETRRRRQQVSRRYRIQEVIKARQVILVQVVKEERGTKGAALTTYLSLAGRYCVLMPNTARGGGISRKISDGKDRKRLKAIVNDLDIPDGMGVIVRTAGAERTKAEIKRDFEYLLRMWEQVRTTTLESTAPALVYEEADLIKRAIRDGYSRDIEEVIVDGDEAFKAARDFMKLLTPSHVKRVKRAPVDGTPLFQAFQVENQLDALHSPQVQLRSGGYIVINPTEALVAIDVNSGRSTRERNIEETALNTNLEAADEVARQLRLRDLAGLIVIDFIDMEHNRNQMQVERRLKEAMRNDRARIQVGRISPFGLLELSRQRLRPSVIETSFEICPHCRGTGMRRTVHSAALHLLRAIEQEGIKRSGGTVTVAVAAEVAFYVLNQKRKTLGEIETRYDITVRFRTDESLIPPEHRIERERAEGKDIRQRPQQQPQPQAVTEIAEEVAETAEAEDQPQREGSESGVRRRRRSRRRKRSDETTTVETTAELPVAQMDATEGTEEGETAERAPAERTNEDGENVVGEDGQTKRRRRGRRGGRRRQRGRSGEGVGAESEQGYADASTDPGQETAEPMADHEPGEPMADRTEGGNAYFGASNGSTPPAITDGDEGGAPDTHDLVDKRDSAFGPAEPTPTPSEPEPGTAEREPVTSMLAENAVAIPLTWATPSVTPPEDDQPRELTRSDEPRAEEAKRTEIIDVDRTDAKGKRGWWRRFSE